MGNKKKSNRAFGMSWDEILQYQPIIKKIAFKYSGDSSLAEDVTQEVILKLYEDKRLDTSKFDPKKKDAAIRNTIRNKTIKVLKSKKIGRWQFDSVDLLSDLGIQVASTGEAVYPKVSHRSDNDLDDGGLQTAYEDYDRDISE